MSYETDRKDLMKQILADYPSETWDDEEILISLLELAYEYGASAGRKKSHELALKTIEEFKHAKS